ncbi:Vibriobactin-specific isochorismatase [Novipirellula galeiformis]|uniref:Vibriobactin-specific isochorismatase n=1 Tax=Novipirellula galeiformis TaxID=2528004 RepID=A0A5C6C9S2_9BACT|nr:Vibriobactin-specific isochorismatase [Novipirellula galeiformis]
MWVIDLQEKLLPVIPSGNAVVEQTMRLIEAAALVEVPHAATLQYPQGLGGLVHPLGDVCDFVEEKRDFSATVCRAAIEDWSKQARDQIVITGVETHVCVLQTVLDLIAEGFAPFVVAEAVASRHGRDHEIAMQRMQAAGATITTVESVLFEWLGTSEHPQFKAISQLVKKRR